MHQQFPYSINDIVSLLGLEISPRSNPNGASYNVRCPICGKSGDNKYKMNINVNKNVYFCPKCCSASQANTGALDLYAMVRFGVHHVPGDGGNGRELFASLRSELEGKGIVGATPTKHGARFVPELIEPVDNTCLNETYTALLSLPYLQLNKKHGNNLLARGLDREAIVEGGYRSLSLIAIERAKPSQVKEAENWYNANHINAYKRNTPALEYTGKKDILPGLVIAGDLITQGVSLERVPGFFKLKGRWCFRFIPGMLIPTKDIKGRIIGLQVRRDVIKGKGVRYLTVSSKDLEGGVTTRIARIHVAKDCDKLNEKTFLYITEGPLKANVILHLLKKQGTSNIAIIAIQGVNSTKGLPEMLEYCKAKGVRKAYSAFDMDKLTNISVARAHDKLKEIFADAGIRLINMTWDNEAAATECARLEALCTRAKLSIPEEENVFNRILLLAKLLTENNIRYDVEVNEKDEEVEKRWDDRSKGFDDWLLFRQKQKDAAK